MATDSAAARPARSPLVRAAKPPSRSLCFGKYGRAPRYAARLRDHGVVRGLRESASGQPRRDGRRSRREGRMADGDGTTRWRRRQPIRHRLTARSLDTIVEDAGIRRRDASVGSIAARVILRTDYAPPLHRAIPSHRESPIIEVWPQSDLRTPAMVCGDGSSLRRQASRGLR